MSLAKMRLDILKTDAYSNFSIDWVELSSRFDDLKIHEVVPVDFTHEDFCTDKVLWDLNEARPAESYFDFCKKIIKINGREQSITRWLTKNTEYLDDILTHLNSVEAKLAEIGKRLATKKTLLISSAPEYILGCSVSKNGKNIASSCHHPDGSGTTTEYKSGPASYLATKKCLIFAVLNPDGHLTGRQVVFTDFDKDNNIFGFITGREYGNITEVESKILRYKLYDMLTPDQTWKKTIDFRTYTNRFPGYQDTSYYKAYRLNKTKTVEITLPEPVCVECYSTHDGREDGLSCCSPENQYDYYCEYCNDGLSDDEAYYGDNDQICCEYCYSERFSRCGHCSEPYAIDDLYNCGGDYYCEDCAEKKHFYRCIDCKEYKQDFYTVDGEQVCDDCVPIDAAYCESCGEHFTEDYITDIAGRVHCDDCADRNSIKKCDICGGYSELDNDNTDGKHICSDCIESHYPGVCDYCGTRTPLEAQGSCSTSCATNNLFYREN